MLKKEKIKEKVSPILDPELDSSIDSIKGMIIAKPKVSNNTDNVIINTNKKKSNFVDLIKFPAVCVISLIIQPSVF